MKNRFTPLHRTLLAAALVTAAATGAAQAQSVGIGTTAPNASAALDVVSSTRGVLLPRMTLTQRGNITTPANGLIIYQTDTAPGFYYNSGTGALPVWERITTATDAVTATNGLTKTGQAIGLGGTLTGATTIAQAGNAFSLTGGNVGIGTAAPLQRLDVSGNLATATANTQSLLRLTRPITPGTKYGNALELALGTYTPSTNLNASSQSQVDFKLADGGTSDPDVTVMSLQGSGNVGIGTTTPTTRLDVNGDLTSRLGVLAFGNINVDRGGINSGTIDRILKFGAPGSTEGIGSNRTSGTGTNQFGLDFYTGNANRLAIANNGYVGIGTTTPSATLDVNGSTRLRGLTTAGIVTTDALGNLSSATGGGSFIQNGTAVQPASNFNISGAGTVGGLLSAGSAAVAGAGTVGGLLSAGSAKINNLTTAGIVTTDAAGNLSSATAASLDPTTATNGLTKTGNVFSLGGALTGATTIAQGSNFFALTGAGQIGLGTAAATGIGAHVTVQAASVTEPGLQVGLSGASTAIAFKTEHNGSNFIVRPVSAGGNSTAIENTGGGALAINPTGGNVGIGTTAPQQLLDVSGNPATATANTQSLLRLTRPITGGIKYANALELALGTYTPSTVPSNASSQSQVDFNLADGITTDPFVTVMSLQGSGNVGIGTTTPTTKLDVNGRTRLRSLTTAGIVTTDALGNLSSATAASIDAATATASNGLTKVANDVRLGGTLNAATTIAQGGNFFALTGGNVGIGTTTPKQFLDVSGSLATATVNTQSLLRLTRPENPGNKFGNALELALGSYDGAINSHSQVDFNLADGGSDPIRTIMSLQSSGNVGIGISTPTAPLDVNGGVKIEYNNTLEFGGGIGGKDGTAGKIGYGSFSNGLSLDIVGAGSTIPGHAITIFAERGTKFFGGIYVDGDGTNNGTTPPDGSNSLLFGKPGATKSAIGSSRLANSPNSFGLDFYTNLIQRMSITGPGYVGIGTTNPLSALDVTGTNYDSTQPYGQKGGGFIRLAGANIAVAPAFATAKIPGTMPGASATNGQTTIALPNGIQGAKVLSITALVTVQLVGPTSVSTYAYPPSGGTIGTSGVEYQVYVFNNSIVIQTGGTASSGTLYGQPVNILITYEQ